VVGSAQSEESAGLSPVGTLGGGCVEVFIAELGYCGRAVGRMNW
jgi:hypothetical protein